MGDALTGQLEVVLQPGAAATALQMTFAGTGGQAYVDPVFGMHITGGSGSIAHSYTQYRELGARTRAMLVNTPGNPAGNMIEPEQLAELAPNRKLRGVRHVVQDEPDDRFMLGDAFLRAAEEHGRRGVDLRTYGGRLLRLSGLAAALEDVQLSGTEVFPLFARLSAAEQHRAGVDRGDVRGRGAGREQLEQPCLVSRGRHAGQRSRRPCVGRAQRSMPDVSDRNTIWCAVGP